MIVGSDVEIIKSHIVAANWQKIAQISDREVQATTGERKDTRNAVTTIRLDLSSSRAARDESS